jgi:glycerol-3-phosphate cytidylyltransferase
MITKKKNILVDMTADIIHHGHIRLLKKASFLGKVIVALTTDEEVKKYKNKKTILNYNQRKEILVSIKYVSKVIPSKWIINDYFLKKNKIDFLVHGNDNSNIVSKDKIKTFKRTKNISSSKIIKKIMKSK